MSSKIYSFDELLDQYSSSREATATLLRMWMEGEEKRVKLQRENYILERNEKHWRLRAEELERLLHNKN